MHHSITSQLRPSPAVGIALAALLVASTGVVSAKPQPATDGVTVLNLSGGPVNTTTPNAEVPILLNGASPVHITQKAGEALQVIATVDWFHPESTAFCGLTVLVVDRDDKLVARVDLHTNKGEFGDGSGVGGLAAPAANRSIALEAFAREDDDCDGDDGADTWTVSVDVSVIGLSD